MNVTAAKVVARGSIVYNVCTSDNLSLPANTVRADAHFGQDADTFEALTMLRWATRWRWWVFVRRAEG